MSTRQLMETIHSIDVEDLTSSSTDAAVDALVQGFTVSGLNASKETPSQDLAARLRLANALSNEGSVATLASLAASRKMNREAARIMSRIRLESLPSDARSSLESTRRLARKKPGTNNFGLGSGAQWLHLEATGTTSVLSRYLQLSDRQESAKISYRQTLTGSHREQLLSTVLANVDIAPNTVVIAQVDGQTELDALWLASTLGLPSILLEVVLTPYTSLGLSTARLLKGVGATTWRLFPSTLITVEEGGRHATALDLVSEKRYKQTHGDFASALRHHGAASIVGRDLEQFVQRNQDFPATPRPIADWIRRDLQRFDDTLPLCATILERLWNSPVGDRAEFAAAQLENYVCEYSIDDIGVVLDSARIQHNRAFQTQIQLRQLFQANNFQLVVEKSSNIPLDLNSRWLRDESVAALELLQRLSVATSNDASTQISSFEKTGPVVCVLHASTPQQSGGYAIRAHGIFKALRRQGVEVQPITRPGFPDDAVSVNQSLPTPTPDTVDDITYDRLAPVTPREVGEAQYMLACVDKYKEALQEKNASALHARSTFLIAIPAIIAARELGLKSVYEVSGLWELVYLAREQERALNGRTNFATFFEKTAVDSADVVITMNYSMMDLLESRGGDRSKMHLAPNAVDIQQFQQADASSSSLGNDTAEQKTTVIGYIGSVVDYEGLDDLARAVSIMRDSRSDFKVVIVGDGLALPSLKSSIAKHDVSDFIETPGRVPHSEVKNLYDSMQIMVYPRHSTPATDVVTPLKPFEALAAGKAIVVSDVPPLKEIVGADERGLVFSTGNSRQLAAVLNRLLDDAELRRSLGEAGQQWVINERDWSSVVTTFTDAYDEIRANNS